MLSHVFDESASARKHRKFGEGLWNMEGPSPKNLGRFQPPQRQQIASFTSPIRNREIGSKAIEDTKSNSQNLERKKRCLGVVCTFV